MAEFQSSVFLHWDAVFHMGSVQVEHLLYFIICVALLGFLFPNFALEHFGAVMRALESPAGSLL